MSNLYKLTHCVKWHSMENLSSALSEKQEQGVVILSPAAARWKPGY